MPNFPNFPYDSNQFKTIVADPPWPYNDSCPGEGRGAEEHYDTLTVPQIKSLGQIANKIAAGHSHLYLWCTNKFLASGVAGEVVESWGFQPKTIITWLKVNEEPDNLPYQRENPVEIRERIGMGHYVRNCTEHIVLGTKGNKRTLENDSPNYFLATRSDHSKKPEKSYDLIEYLSEGPYLNMFARDGREGWEAWGKEVEEKEEE